MVIQNFYASELISANVRTMDIVRSTARAIIYRWNIESRLRQTVHSQIQKLRFPATSEVFDDNFGTS
jgi:hypothetical protein